MNPANPTERDPDGMRDIVLQWPAYLRRGAELSLSLPDSLRNKAQIVCAGMGGSAIAASIIGEFARESFAVPYVVVRDYTLPAYVGEQTLVLCISNSGNTEETLAAYDAARARGAAVACLATGGELLERARRDEVPFVQIKWDSQPRAALPLGLGLLLNLFATLGYLPDQADDLAQAATAVTAAADRANDPDDPGSQLAEQLHGRVPIVYGAGFLGEAARRLKGQISENANQTAAFEVLPEQNHNALVGFEFPEHMKDSVVFVLLRAAAEHPRHTLRLDITKDLLQKRGLAVAELPSQGETPLAQLCTSLFWGDLASVELAYRNGVDPTPVDVITELKQRLASG